MWTQGGCVVIVFAEKPLKQKRVSERDKFAIYSGCVSLYLSSVAVYML